MFKVHKTLNYSLITLLNISKHFMFKVHDISPYLRPFNIPISKHFMFKVHLIGGQQYKEFKIFQNISCLRFIFKTFWGRSILAKFQNISCLRFIVKGLFDGLGLEISKHFMFKVH